MRKLPRTYESSSQAGYSPDVEINNQPSLTVPDQSYSVREIMQKFAQGTLPDIYKEPEFSEDLPDLRGLDISEIFDMKQTVKDEIKTKKQKYEDLETQKKLVASQPNPPITE